jgi:hypothetical protein
MTAMLLWAYIPAYSTARPRGPGAGRPADG